MHVSLTLDNPIEFFNDKAEISGVVAINFNDSLFPRGGEQWDNLDEKMARKVQKLFDSIGQMGDPASDDGRDKCLSNLTINKLKKMDFELSSDHFYIDKGFKDAYTGSVVAEGKELR